MITITFLSVLFTVLMVKHYDGVRVQTKTVSMGVVLLSLAVVTPIETLERVFNGWHTPAYYGSVTLSKLTGKSNKTFLDESPKSLWLDITTGTTRAQREATMAMAE